MKKEIAWGVILAGVIIIIGFLILFAFVNEKKEIELNDKNQTTNKSIVKTTSNSVVCVDSDSNSEFPNGNNMDIAGKTCVGSNCKLDNCTSQRNINEYYCNGDKIAVVNSKCLPGSFCKSIFNGSAYCANSVQNLTLKSDKTKVTYTSDKKKMIGFSSSVKMEPFNPFPYTIYLNVRSVSAGKYITYPEKEMKLNKTTGMYSVSFPIYSFETYGEPITNVTAEAIAKTDNVVVARSKPVGIIVNR
jgi:hypothetical protein